MNLADHPRRIFLKNLAMLSAAMVINKSSVSRADSAEPALGGKLTASGITVPPISGPAANVRPTIGTGGHGHVFPGAALPFGLVQVSPDTPKATTPFGIWPSIPGTRVDLLLDALNTTLGQWDHSSGYHYTDTAICGFSHTHISGCGIGDLGDVLLVPITGAIRWEPGTLENNDGYASLFSHEQEAACAGYYSVLLLNHGILAELTATMRCGMHRYTFPAGVPRHVILDLVHVIYNGTVTAGNINVENSTTISGFRSTKGWAKERDCYFVAEFSQPFDALFWANGQALPTRAMRGGPESITDLQVKAALSFDETFTEPLIIKVGISATSIAGAKKNLAKEIPGWDFDQIQRAALDEWNSALSAIDAEIPDESDRQVFYTAMYHGMVAPATFNDVDGSYRGEDKKNHPYKGFTKYATLSIWDIFRCEFPFLMLTQLPQLANDVVQSLLADYVELNRHTMPVWPLWAYETFCMDGFHSAALVLSAYVRGFRDWDAQAVYAALKDTAMNNPDKRVDEFRKFGFVPTGPKKSSVSCTLDFAYDFWCVGALAELLGKTDDAKEFYKLSQNYRNLFDPKTGFMRGKNLDGTWREPFRPDEEYHEDYVEVDAWQATFNVMQDLAGLIDLFGGDENFIAKLDALFAAPPGVVNGPPDISGFVGQCAQGNEPSNHFPFLYNYAGAPWKTQYWSRQVLRLCYNNTPAGLPGNDDCGQISTWAVFAMLGFYPVNAGNGVYVIGSPTVNRATINNPATKTAFTIITENNSPENMYIQSVTLNGKDLQRSWLTYEQIAAGGELVFQMGSTPNKEWGSAPEDRPPSGLLSK
ncbi:MAG TPA: GH92 family glycosyl hydrolase [Phycisphaerae bacterium]|nr:GH92 family glycosyl hydrolase [Phycisphaerae bacterium]